MFAIVDCNNFYVSCERLFRPDLEGKPVVVLSNNDGCIISRSEEAKKLDLNMAEAYYKVEPLLKKHGVAVFSSNYPLYADMSSRVMEALQQLVTDVDVYSVDEAFLDLTAYEKMGWDRFGRSLKQQVGQWTGIPVSLGIAPTRTLSKVANHIAKKNRQGIGVHVLDSKEVIKESLIRLPLTAIWGIGRGNAERLHQLGIRTAWEFANARDTLIRKNLSVVGLRTARELRGEPCIKGDPIPDTRKRICTSRSFGQKLTKLEDLEEAVANYVVATCEKLRHQRCCANLVNIFIRTNPNRKSEPQYTPSKTIQLPNATNDTLEILKHALMGLRMIYKKGYRYKNAGVIVAGMEPQRQISYDLFNHIDREKSNSLMKAVDHLNQSMGRETIRYAAQGASSAAWKPKMEMLSPHRTTSWKEILTIRL